MNIKELPQNLLGKILLKKYLKLEVIPNNLKIQQLEKEHDVRITVVTKNSKEKSKLKSLSGTSLGRYIFLDNTYSMNSVKHEIGHSIQSKKFGCFYLLIVGLPSLSNNLWVRLFHRKWDNERSIKWYYSRWPEKQADILGGVNRFR